MLAQTAAAKRITLRAGSFFGDKQLSVPGGSIVKTNVKQNQGVVFGALVNGRVPKGSTVRLILRQADGTLVGQSFPLN